MDNVWIQLLTAIIGSSALSSIFTYIIGFRERNAPAHKMESWVAEIEHQRSLEESGESSPMARSYAIIGRQILVEKISKILVPTPITSLMLVVYGIFYFAIFGVLILSLNSSGWGWGMIFLSILLIAYLVAMLVMVDIYRGAITGILDARRAADFEKSHPDPEIVRNINHLEDRADENEISGHCRHGDPSKRASKNSIYQIRFRRFGDFILGPSPRIYITILREELTKQ